MARSVSVNQLYSKKFKVMPFEGHWKDLIGQPELKGSWLIYGPPANGKTTFVLQLCKYLTNFVPKILYDSLEEGESESMKKAFKRVGMEEVKNRITLLDCEPIDELKERLRKQKSPKIIVIDSLQYTGLTYKEYKLLRAEFPKKLFIFIAHGEGKEPKGSVAKAVNFDAFVKIRVDAYVATSLSRYADGSHSYVVWKQGADKAQGIIQL